MTLQKLLIAAIIAIVILFGFRECSHYKKLNDNGLKTDTIESFAQKTAKAVAYYDSVIISQEEQIDSLKVCVSDVKEEKKNIAVKWKTVHDTILSTPDIDSLQIKLTHKLCPGDLQQINLCLEEGLKNGELLKETGKELIYKDSIISKQSVIISSSASKDRLNESLIDAYKSDNNKLTKQIKKEVRRKKFFRGLTVIGGVVIGVLLLVH